MTAAKNIVIVGGGQAGFQTAASLRQGGYAGALTLLADEPCAPYQRPPLSKDYLKGALAAERLFFRPLEFYAQSEIALRTEAQVTQVQPDAHEVVLADGARVGYDRLVLATGSRPRALAGMAGRDLRHIYELARLADSDALRARLDVAAPWGIVGGGYIGLEVAASARALGASVCVLEAADRLLARVTAPPISEFFAELHRSHGVDVRCNAQVTAMRGGKDKDALAAIELADGTSLPAATALIGIGAAPQVALAEAAGLQLDKESGGIVIDAAGRTSAPDIYACGDCAAQYHPLYERSVRLESVQNAVDQARLVAAALLEAKSPAVTVPWFWSDQYNVKLQIAGLAQGYDALVQRGKLGGTEAPSFALFYFRERRLIACDAVNRAAEFMSSRRLIAAGAKIDPAVLADDTNRPQDWRAQ